MNAALDIPIPADASARPLPVARLGLSIVIPTYNEEESVLDLYARLRAVLDESPLRWEIVFDPGL